MKQIEHDFKEKVNHIELYLNFLKNIENGAFLCSNKNKQSVDNDLFKVLKANIFLLLYNLLESTVRQTVEFIHIEINNGNFRYSKIKQELKEIWIDYKYKRFKEKKSKDILNILNAIENDVFKVDYFEYKKASSSDFSGNIDARKVRELSDKYAFTKNRRVKGANLVRVKKLRNDLAHGNITFTECGKDYICKDLIKYKKEVVLFLKEYLNNVESYIKNKEFIV
jgi:hypothetical protein